MLKLLTLPTWLPFLRGGQAVQGAPFCGPGDGRSRCGFAAPPLDRPTRLLPISAGIVGRKAATQQA
jgi:hypothetical protein